MFGYNANAILSAIIYDEKSAFQQIELHMANDSSFNYLPHPVVPHKHSNFSASNKLYLASGCSLIWGEVLTCGRKLNGEIFDFTRYHNNTEIYLSGRLAIKENLLLQPSMNNVDQLGQMEGYTHQATLIYLDEKASAKELINNISDYLIMQKETIFGITTAPLNGIIIRLLGQKAEQLYNCLRAIAENYFNNDRII